MTKIRAVNHPSVSKSARTLRGALAFASLAVVATLGACTTPATVAAPDGDAGTKHTTDHSDAGDAVDATEAPTCPISFEKTACQSCFTTKCGVTCAACAADGACNSALICAANCADTACVAACTSGLSSAQRASYDAVLGDKGCALTTCRAQCRTPGEIGDPCSVGADCGTGVCSDGGWCEATCTENTDCGINSAGDLIWCMPTTAGTKECFPGCTSNADCRAFPGAATTCQSYTATNGNAAHICAF